jgi:hypothetical protein
MALCGSKYNTKMKITMKKSCRVLSYELHWNDRSSQWQIKCLETPQDCTSHTSSFLHPHVLLFQPSPLNNCIAQIPSCQSVTHLVINVSVFYEAKFFITVFWYSLSQLACINWTCKNINRQQPMLFLRSLLKRWERPVSVLLDHLQALFLSYHYKISTYTSRRPYLLQISQHKLVALIF